MEIIRRMPWSRIRNKTACTKNSWCENHREPEVPEAGVPVGERLDDNARITSKEFAITHFVKMAPSRMLVLQDQEWLSVWGKVLIRTSSGRTAEKEVQKER